MTEEDIKFIKFFDRIKGSDHHRKNSDECQEQFGNIFHLFKNVTTRIVLFEKYNKRYTPSPFELSFSRAKKPYEFDTLMKERFFKINSLVKNKIFYDNDKITVTNLYLNTTFDSDKKLEDFDRVDYENIYNVFY